ncbi:MAG: hypothetical protein M0Z42_13195 [Actinomycetota bacterium]|nr:hypothetical protein [Actinomycetota bacterium]
MVRFLAELPDVVRDWDDERDPSIGETVLVADGEARLFEAKIGTIVIAIPAFAA